MARRLPLFVKDAQFSTALGRLVLLTGQPSRVVLLDPTTATGEALELPEEGKFISLAPSGHSAAIAHERAVSIVDLESHRVKSTISTSTSGDVVMTDAGFVYLFPDPQEDSQEIHSIDIEAGKDLVDEQDNNILSGRAFARLHPDGNEIYGISRGQIPASLYHYDVSAGPAASVRPMPSGSTSSPADQDIELCGDLWISRDGKQLYNGCGSVVDVTPDDAKGPPFVGVFANPLGVSGRVFQSVYDDATHAKIYALRAANQSGSALPPGSPVVEVYTYPSLAAEAPVSLPCLTTPGQDFSFGGYVFTSNDGSQIYVLGMDVLPEGGYAWTLVVSTFE